MERGYPIKGYQWWCDILNCCKMFENDLGWFQNNISRVVGDGREVSFWRTRWLGRESLLKNFNRIFLNLEQRDAKIAEVSSWNMGTMDETLVPMGTNSTAANVGLDTIGEFRPKQNKPDGWAWNLNVEVTNIFKGKKVLFGGWHMIEFKLWIT